MRHIHYTHIKHFFQLFFQKKLILFYFFTSRTFSLQRTQQLSINFVKPPSSNTCKILKNGIYFESSYARVAEWQTRRFQVPVVATLCGFNSHLLHQLYCIKKSFLWKTNPYCMQWWLIGLITGYRIDRKDNTEILKRMIRWCLF